MSLMTINLPCDQHHRLQALAEQKNIPIQQLIEQATTALLTEHDAYVRFQSRANRGNPTLGMHLLDKAIHHTDKR